MEPFDYGQINEECSVELVLNSNTWNHFTVCKQIINIELNYKC